MKVKLIVLGFMLSFLCELNAQNDAFFIEKKQVRVEDNIGFDFSDMSFGNGQGFSFELFDEENGNGFSFDIFDDNNNNSGLSFGDFEFRPDGVEDSEEVPLGNGILLLTTAALIYFILKEKEMKTNY